MFPLVFNRPGHHDGRLLHPGLRRGGHGVEHLLRLHGLYRAGPCGVLRRSAPTRWRCCARCWHVPGGYLPFALLPLAGLVAAVFRRAAWVDRPADAPAHLHRDYHRHLFIFQLLAYNLRGLTAGSAWVPHAASSWSRRRLNLPFYYVTVIVLLVAIGRSWFVRHSKYGLELLAIRDDEDRALGLGVRTSCSSSARSRSRRSLWACPAPSGATTLAPSIPTPDSTRTSMCCSADGVPGRTGHNFRPAARRADPAAPDTIPGDATGHAGGLYLVV